MLFYNTSSCQLAFNCIVDSRGYHVYQTTWKAPSLTDKLSLKLEPLNEEDPHAVAVIRQSDVVGHIPREISRHVFWFIKVGSTTQLKLHSTKLYQSPIALKGLDFLLDVTFLLLHLSMKY